MDTNEILYKKYTANCGMNFTDFQTNIQLLDNKMGTIKFYKYSGMSSSAGGQFADITGFFIYYKLITNDNKIYNVTFQIDTDSNDNQLTIRKINRFSINQNFGVDSYSLLLNSKDSGTKKGTPRAPGWGGGFRTSLSTLYMGAGISQVEWPFGSAEWGYDIGTDFMGGISIGKPGGLKDNIPCGG